MKKFFEIFFSVSRKTSDERRSNLVVVRSEERSQAQQSGKRNEKESSLTSLRKDNEVKLEDEIKKSVTSNKIESLS